MFFFGEFMSQEENSHDMDMQVYEKVGKGIVVCKISWNIQTKVWIFKLALISEVEVNKIILGK